MKLPTHSRLIALLGAGLVLIGLAALGVRESRRGVSYYFPVWVGPNWSDSVELERYAELTDVARSLPIVLAAIERQPSEFGERWGQLRDGLPNFINGKLPQYRDPSWSAMWWLREHCSEPEVAKIVTEQWPRWNELIRINWLGALAPAVVTNRLEYQPFLRQLCLSTNAREAFCAAYLLGAYRPLSEGDTRLLAHAWTNQPLVEVGHLERSFALQLARMDQASPTLIASLHGSLSSANPMRAALSALTLAKLAPAGFPPQTTFEPLWPKLSLISANRVLGMLQRPEIRSVASSAWGLGFLAKLLAAAPITNNLPTVATGSLTAAALDVLEKLGPAGAEAAPAIWTLLADTNASNQREAARAFAAVAPPSPDYLTAIHPYLTNERTAVPLLLWLTSIGTNASLARGTVQQLAIDAILVPEHDATAAYRMDFELARRYGLTARASSVSPPAAQPAAKNRLRKPSKVEVIARNDCPRALVHLWPGFDAIQPRHTNQSPDVLSDTYFQALFNQLPKSNLADLAQRCLLSMTNGLPSSPPAVPH